MGRRGRLLTLVDMVGKVMREVRFGRERIMVAVGVTGGKRVGQGLRGIRGGNECWVAMR